MKQNDRDISGIQSQKPVGKIEAIRNWINANYTVKINMFDTSRSWIESKEREYDHPVTVSDIHLHMVDDSIQCSFSLLREIITNPNQMESCNPILDYLNSLDGKYSGTSMIDLFCRHIKAHDFGDNKDDYYSIRLNYLVRKWMVATVAQIYAKHVNDVAIGFVNAKGGIGKSTLVKSMVPISLMDYYIISDKDERIFNMSDSFCTKLLINFDEFVGITKSTAETFKKNMSLLMMNKKRPNESFSVTVPRIASCAFTSNKTQEMGGFLPNSDSGLLRRIAAIEIDEIDTSYSQKVDVDQMWSEALLLYQKSDFDYVWNTDDFDSLVAYNQRYVVETCAVKVVKENYTVPSSIEEETFKMPSQILRDLRLAHRVHSYDRVDEQSIGQALKLLGFEKKAKRVENGTRYGYLVHPLY